MRCSNCKNEVFEEDQYCSQCGAKLFKVTITTDTRYDLAIQMLNKRMDDQEERIAKLIVEAYENGYKAGKSKKPGKKT